MVGYGELQPRPQHQRELVAHDLHEPIDMSIALITS